MDSCGSIAYYYSLTVEQLEKLNPALDCEIVGPYPGYEICVTGGKVVTQAPPIEETVNLQRIIPLDVLPAYCRRMQGSMKQIHRGNSISRLKKNSTVALSSHACKCLVSSFRQGSYSILA